MILIKRTAIPAKLEAESKKELRDILEHFEKRKRKEGFVFKAYKVDGVANALNALFHGKCAYCESRIATVHPSDIDHFRPKSAVLIDGKEAKPGYYWLAAAWDNLLPSCIYCNRPNRHEFRHEKVTLGKGTHFPLSNEKSRARRSSHRQRLEAEEPLILDPCGKIDPCNHLEFQEDGDVSARNGSPRGSETIRILALRRTELVRERRARALKLIGELALMAKVRNRREFGEHVRYLALFLDPAEPYLAMTRELIDREQPGLLDMVPAVIQWLETHRRTVRQRTSAFRAHIGQQQNRRRRQPHHP